MSDNDLRTMMRDAAADAPAREFSTPVIASAARARTRRRRTWYGVGALGAAACATAVAAVGFGALGGPSPSGTPVAVGPTASAPSDPGAIDPGGISLPTSLPLGEAVAVVDEALPDGVSVGELPMDAAWTPEGTLSLPLAGAGADASIALTATASGCSAESAALDAATLDAVSSGICAAAAQYPNQPGTVVDSGPVDPAA